MVRRVFSIQGLAVASFSQRTNADARRNLTTRGAMRGGFLGSEAEEA